MCNILYYYMSAHVSIYCVQYLYYRAVDDKISNAAFGGVEESGIGGVGAVTLTSSDRRLGIVAATCSGNTFSFTIMCVEHVYISS